MSVPQQPDPAKLVVGFILKEKRLLGNIIKVLVERFGPIDLVSPWLPFDFTQYYTEEMGQPLQRRMIAFKRMIQQTDLTDIKLFTNDLETGYLKSGKRQVNIDPGYLLLERFILGTGKNFSHRIYLDKGIYADLTLIFHKQQFRSLPWTYPDYAHENIQTFLKKVREKYKIDLKQLHQVCT